MMVSAEEAFRRFAIGEPNLIEAIGGLRARLDARTEALLRVSALIAIDAPVSSYRTVVEAAILAGAGLEDLVAVLLAVADTVGSARVASAAPRVALAAGYDVEAALE